MVSLLLCSLNNLSLYQSWNPSYSFCMIFSMTLGMSAIGVDSVSLQLDTANLPQNFPVLPLNLITIPIREALVCGKYLTLFLWV